MGIEPAERSNSLAAVATMLIDYGVPGMPVVEGDHYLGMVYESDLLEFESKGSLAPVESVMRSVAPILNRASASEALRRFDLERIDALAVVDDLNRVIGVITPSRIFAPTDRYIRPKLVGGMATPSGVRLLGGGVTGGASDLKIVGTGALMFLTFLVASYAVLGLTHLLPDSVLMQPWFASAFQFAQIGFFLLLLRMQPLSGYHAAEHMVVHAIEQNEPIEPETVARMPRIHPRCGTNIAVALGLFLGILSLEWFLTEELRVLIGLLAALFLFRPLGAFVQHAFTTRPPTPGQIQAGVDAGRQLLHRYQTGTARQNSIPLRLWQSGMLQAITGSTLMGIALMLLFEVLNLPPSWRVF